MLYTKDLRTGDHLVIDGEEVLRLRTRAEALAVASRRLEEKGAAMERSAADGDRPSHP